MAYHILLWYTTRIIILFFLSRAFGIKKGPVPVLFSTVPGPCGKQPGLPGFTCREVW
jgi:hypothetical protein